MKIYCCPECGNNKTFYREISVVAKLKVNSKGQDLKTVYDIDKTHIDGHYEDYIYCAKCDLPILQTDG